MLTSRTTLDQRATRTQPETHANGGTKGNHGQMSGAEDTAQLCLCAMIVEEDIAGDRVLPLGLELGIVALRLNHVRLLCACSFGVHDEAWSAASEDHAESEKEDERP
jgi:hypothetical protein